MKIIYNYSHELMFSILDNNDEFTELSNKFY